MFTSLRSMETQYSFCVKRVCAPKTCHEQQSVHSNVSSFARAFNVIPLKLFLGMIPSFSEDVARAMRGQPKRLSRNYRRRNDGNVIVCFYFVSLQRCSLYSQPSFCSAGHSFVLNSFGCSSFGCLMALGSLRTAKATSTMAL